MKLTIPRTDLLAAIAAVKPASRGSSQPILSNLLLKADGKLTLTATDLDLFLRASTDAVVAKEGKTTVRAQLFHDIIRMAEGADVSLELVKHHLTVQCGNARHSLNTLPPDDFPSFPRVKVKEGRKVTEFDLEDSIFRNLLAETSFAASTDESRAALCGTLLSLDGASIHVVACDGRRIAVSSVDSPIETKAAIVITSKAARELLRLLGTDVNKPGRLVVSVGDNNAQFQFTTGKSELTILSRLVEGNYPDYNRIIPKDNPITTLPRAELLRSIERIALVSDDVQFEFSGSTLHLRSFGRRGHELVGDAEDSLLITAKAKDPIKVRYAARFLRDTLSAIGEDALDFSIAPNRLCLFKAPSREWRGVIAPVKEEEVKKAEKTPEPKPEPAMK